MRHELVFFLNKNKKRPFRQAIYGSPIWRELAEGEQTFPWTFQNTDYRNHRVVQCEIAEWCTVNDSATGKTLTIRTARLPLLSSL